MIGAGFPHSTPPGQVPDHEVQWAFPAKGLKHGLEIESRCRSHKWKNEKLMNTFGLNFVCGFVVMASSILLAGICMALVFLQSVFCSVIWAALYLHFPAPTLAACSLQLSSPSHSTKDCRYALMMMRCLPEMPIAH